MDLEDVLLDLPVEHRVRLDMKDISKSTRISFQFILDHPEFNWIDAQVVQRHDVTADYIRSRPRLAQAALLNASLSILDILLLGDCSGDKNSAQMNEAIALHDPAPEFVALCPDLGDRLYQCFMHTTDLEGMIERFPPNPYNFRGILNNDTVTAEQVKRYVKQCDSYVRVNAANLPPEYILELLGNDRVDCWNIGASVARLIDGIRLDIVWHQHISQLDIVNIRWCGNEALIWNISDNPNMSLEFVSLNFHLVDRVGLDLLIQLITPDLFKFYEDSFPRFESGLLGWFKACTEYGAFYRFCTSPEHDGNWRRYDHHLMIIDIIKTPVCLEIYRFLADGCLQRVSGVQRLLD